MASTMPTRSAGILLYRTRAGRVEVLIAHMGGPLWARRDERAWSIIKGEHGADEEPLAAALREFAEETGRDVPPGTPVPLGEARQKSGKLVCAWALEADFPADSIDPGTFTMEWPPRSGRLQEFPEIDRVAWFDIDTAAHKLVAGQVQFLERLASMLDAAAAGR
jgi:predicted NUDIX family NTP pyrophosphohydrolase